MTSHTHDEPTAVLEADERAELERLRAEVTRLRADVAAHAPGKPRPRRMSTWGRTLIGSLLILISCLLAPLSVVSVWARGQVTDTDRYVDTVAPLAKDPTIQQAVTDNLTNLVFQYIDVQGLTTQVLTGLSQRDIVPPAVGAQLPALAVPITNGIKSFTREQVQKLVQSDAFVQAWEQANRTAHGELVAALNGESSAVTVQNNTVSVNLATLITAVKQQLIANGFELAAKIPEVNAQFTVFQSADVGKVQKAFNLLDTLGYWLPFILVALAGLGIYLVPNHRLAFVWTGIGVALAALLSAVLVQWVRSRYLAGVPAAVLPPDAAASVFDTVVRYLREAVRALALAGVIAALGAFLTGPSVTATTIRRWCVGGAAWVKGHLEELGLDLGGVTRWVAPRARLLRGIAVAVAIGFVLLQTYKTPSLILWTTVALLAALALIELLAVEPRRPRSSPAETAPATAAATVPAPARP